MSWEVVVATLVAAPIVFFPVALVWFLNISGMNRTFKQAKMVGKQVR